MNVAIPKWVPLSLQRLYSQIAAERGEEEAASEIRARKRQIAKMGLGPSAEIDTRVKLGFKVRLARE
jgi:hypothetical protein